ncbi:MAG: DnaD domain protein [Lachnospiraceae bacterium]|nr:DnaD domain protein [Lachnospiraceae bacterium]
MDTLTLFGDYSSAFTFIQNDFIDYHLRDINESQIKVYLYLLRSAGSNLNVSVSSIADFFNDSEKDVIRALKYLDKQKLITLEYDKNKEPSGIRLLPAGHASSPDRIMDKENEKTDTPVDKSEAFREKTTDIADRTLTEPDIPKKRTYSASELSAFKERSEIGELIYATETYLKKTLSPNDIASILYMNDELSMSCELIEFLIEYCIGNKKKSMRYIESVAVLWAKNGISTVEEARAYAKNVPAETAAILSAFGIQGREPLVTELSFIKKWVRDGDFPLELIKEACERTLRTIEKPSFEYADKILKNWKKAGVKTFSDIEAQDALFAASKKSAQSAEKKTKKAVTGSDDYVSFAKRQIERKNSSK